VPRPLSVRARRLLVGVLVGGGIGILAGLLALFRPSLLERAELWTYDARARQAAHPDRASSDIVLIEVGDYDLHNVAEVYDQTWPWPRELFGYLVEYASQSGARVVLLDFMFPDPSHKSAEDDEAFARMMKQSGRAVLAMQAAREGFLDAARPPPGRWGAALRTYPTRAQAEAAALVLVSWNKRVYLTSSPGRPDTTLWIGGYRDAAETADAWQHLTGNERLASLVEGLAAPHPRELGKAELAAEWSAADLVRERDAVPHVGEVRGPLPQVLLELPVPVLADGAARTANVLHSNDLDGIQRRYTHLVGTSDGRLYPSLAMAGYLVAHPGLSVRVEERTIVVGDRRIPIDEEGVTAIRYHGGNRLYPRIPAYDVLQSQADRMEHKPPKVAPARLVGKYVIIAPSAYGLRDYKASPIEHFHLGAVITANALDNLLSGQFVRRTSRLVDAALAFAMALVLSVFMVGLWQAIHRPLLAFAAATGLTVTFLGGTFWVGLRLLDSRGLWIGLATPLGGAVCATVASLLAASTLERRERRFVQEALGRYTSDALVDELLAHPEYLSLEWGEQRAVSVYFSDIAGFTSFSEALEPKRLVALLNDYLTTMTDIVLSHGGIVDKYIGDAVMAFWGAPIARADHARQAVRAALAMRRACDRLRPGWKAEYGHLVVARAGVNTGQAVVGNMGSRHKYNYTVMGDMVNLASRLEGANKPYGTTLMISQFTHAAVAAEFDFRELDRLAVKGKEEPVRVFEVLAERGGADPALSEAVRHFELGLSRYRAQEFGAAIGCFEQALAIRPEDGPSRTYIERCRHFLTEPPGSGWDGVWHMKEK
jgi:adenylate cyclase